MKATTNKPLSDYTIDSRVLYVSALACLLGALSTVGAWALIRLIALSTNLFYLHRFSFLEVSPDSRPLHWWAALVPVAGGLLVGLMARFGSPKVRGHGMPEAVEVIVFQGGRVSPRIAVLKPIATAISIGSGGPFGAEGPVIMTGGAIGSVIGQLLPVSDSERAVLMVSGAAAGVAAAFNCPMSAVLLAVELLLFEWRPRSLVPVAMACVTAGSVRHLLLGSLPIFPMPPTTGLMHHAAMLAALLIGFASALGAIGLSRGIHLSEHFFEVTLKKIHWMWWPAIGGIVVGLGGMIFPPALGAGYEVIQQLVSGDITWRLLAGVLIVKSIIWMFSLGSNTAGGILAPLLMIGAALGVTLGHWMPFLTPGAWAVVGMTAMLSAALGAPLTSAMLAVELTHNGGLMLPVLLACICSYGISILISPRSMLTEGLSRKGLHLSRDYGVDPLEVVMVSAVMHTSVFALPADARRSQAADWFASMNARGPGAWSHWQRIFPLVHEDGRLAGILTRAQMVAAAQAGELERPLLEDGSASPTTLFNMQTLRQAAMVMAESKHTAFPVLDAQDKFAGIVTISDLLQARTLAEQRERERSRVLRLRWPFRSKPDISA
ncbi:CBS domain-containing protein [Granulicella sp. WH15]|uniref:chloride channel protein n=1 Tax=Granulicella sp. WH15 TaxID=2602070 RepID=UPI001366D668|nr:chloride channel protein [Granulicella sp. WH15]QHN04083.1 CBS domain-containing protein [Granulicella sp. WH15]